MNFLIQLLVGGIFTGTVYALMALAIVVIYKSSSVFNFAHGALVAFTTFLLWELAVQWKLSLILVFPLYLIWIALLGAVIQRLILQPLTGQPLMAAVMATIALGDVFSGLSVLFWPGPGRAFPEVIPSTNLRLGPAVFSLQSLIIFGVCSACFLVFLLFFQKTKIGLAMRGTAEDHNLAQSEGIRVNRIFILSWAVAILMAAIGGTLMSSLYGVNFEPLAGLGMKSLSVVILGGMESIPGALLGGLIIGLLESFGAGYIDPFVGGGFSEVAPFIVLLVVLIFKPYGLFGYERIERV
jgi:branched-chain amino acid transport system permease protein